MRDTERSQEEKLTICVKPQLGEVLNVCLSAAFRYFSGYSTEKSFGLLNTLLLGQRANMNTREKKTFSLRMNAQLATATWQFSKSTEHATWTLHLNVLSIQCVTCTLLIWIRNSSRTLLAEVTGIATPSVWIQLYFCGCSGNGNNSKLAKFDH